MGQHQGRQVLSIWLIQVDLLSAIVKLTHFGCIGQPSNSKLKLGISNSVPDPKIVITKLKVKSQLIVSNDM